VKALAAIFDFVTGGSVAAPLGTLAAVLVAHFGRGLAPAALATAFFGTLLLTFLASTLERAR
jgi:hypothetical protein